MKLFDLNKTAEDFMKQSEDGVNPVLIALDRIFYDRVQKQRAYEEQLGKLQEQIRLLNLRYQDCVNNSCEGIRAQFFKSTLNSLNDELKAQVMAEILGDK